MVVANETSQVTTMSGTMSANTVSANTVHAVLTASFVARMQPAKQTGKSTAAATGTTAIA